MQCGLIDHRAGENRTSIVFQRDGQAAKPVCPLLSKMALDPDLVDFGLIRIGSWNEVL